MLVFNKYIKQIRVNQWVKNFTVFIPLFFAGKIFNFEQFYDTILAFLALCMMSSSVYIINDIMDIEKDKSHPYKKFRPLASGSISKSNAIILFLFLIVTTLSLSISLKFSFFYLICGYLAINLCYSFGLKKIAILDISIIAIGFILRIFAGGIIAEIHISKWLILMTFLLALLLALAKRRDDLLILEKTGQQMRKSLEGYNFEFINAAMIFMASVTTVAYLMYTVSEEVVHRINNDYVYVTTFPVIIGLLRYLQLTFVENNSGSPTKILLTDRVIQIVICIWFFIFYVLIYSL